MQAPRQGMGGSSTAGVNEPSSTGSLVVGSGGGTSDQSSVTAPTLKAAQIL